MFCAKCSTTVIHNKLFKANTRCIFINSLLKKSHYDSLEITPKATQNDIKAAYYKLSMIYHPDKNKGSADAANTFRNITAAYEVLGNLKTRKLYDKGILHTAGAEFQNRSHSEVTEEDDAQTRFYKAHMNRTKRPTASGRTAIYDFDEWSKNHYSSSFTRHKTARENFDKKQKRILRDQFDIQNELVVLSIAMVVLVFMLMQVKDRTDYDVVDRNTKNSEADHPEPPT